jgi:hypothetical protein
VADHHRPLLDFAQLVAADASTGGIFCRLRWRAYLKWSKISAGGEHPLGYVRRIIVNENASLWRRAWRRRERSTDSVPEAGALDPSPIDTTWKWCKGCRHGNGPRWPCGSTPISASPRLPRSWAARSVR